MDKRLLRNNNLKIGPPIILMSYVFINYYLKEDFIV